LFPADGEISVRHHEDVAKTSVQWLSDVEQRAWRAFLSSHTRIVRALDAELHAELGTSLGDHEVLIMLSEHDGAMRMADLADMVTLSRSGLTRRIDHLVTAGLVERRRCPSDGRGVLAVITDAGRDQLGRATPTHIAGVRRHFAEHFDAEELEALAKAHERIAGDQPGGC
jgi:DNA-binding MarR family transcriptional regulator